MDERIHDHAEVLVDWSARVEAGDDVVLRVGPEAHDLAVAVAAVLGERGANLQTTYESSEVSRAYITSHDGDFDEDPDHKLAVMENADVVLKVSGDRNTAEAADIPGERLSAYSQANQGVKAARLDSRWVSTVHPTHSLAQQAGMSIAAYRDFVYEAIIRDWSALAEEMAQLKDLLDAGSEVHLVGPGTDLTMSIEGRTAINSCASVAYDSHNLPSGEVFTAPTETEGTVTFDIPMTIRGQRVQDVRLVFEDGEVVDHEAAQGEDVLTEILETDEGARRLGELGIGMNRGIDRVTDNILFDEKMAETVHLAVGRAYDSCLPEGEAGNDSAVHTDLIKDVAEDAHLAIDGEIIQRNGTFRWEDDFEAGASQ